VHSRILFGAAAWLLGAATATTGSLLAVSLLGQGITGQSLRAVSGKGTTPQVFIGGKLIGGADELERYFAGGARKAA